MKYAAVKENEHMYDTQMMCALLEVSTSGYYAWKNRPPSRRSLRNDDILEKMRAIHEESRQAYGSPRIHAHLCRVGEKISLKRVERLMKKNGIVVKTRKRFKATTNSKHKYKVAPNYLDHAFDPLKIGAPNCCWAGDITYIDMAEGWLYLAVVLDLFSRRAIGWAMSSRMFSELVTDALAMAFSRCDPGPGFLYHSDRGVQYASDESQQMLEKYGMICSMSRKGNCWDNAVIESWNGTLKTELTHRQRLHSTLNYRSPEEFESLFAQGFL